MNRNSPHRSIVASRFFLSAWTAEVFGLVEGTAPGNLRGIRVDGELLAFRTSVRAVVAENGLGGRGRGAADSSAAMTAR